MPEPHEPTGEITIELPCGDLTTLAREEWQDGFVRRYCPDCRETFDIIPISEEILAAVDSRLPRHDGAIVILIVSRKEA
jgi:hypothetical protein